MRVSSDAPIPSSSQVQDLIASPRGVRSVFTPTKRYFLLLLLSLALVTAVLLRGIHKGEFIENVDETVHAPPGLYVAFFFHALPCPDPARYTSPSYPQSPTLRLLISPPPS